MCKKIYKQDSLVSWAAFNLDPWDKLLTAHTSPTVEISSMAHEAPVKKEHNTEAQVHHHLQQNCTLKPS
jgi:hypothetical protein